MLAEASTIVNVTGAEMKLLSKKMAANYRPLKL